MVTALKKFAADLNGATMVEMAVAMPMLLILLLGFVDFGYAFYQWNAANKAVQVGARIAQVSSPVASGLAQEAKTPSDTTLVGAAVPAGTYDYICTADAAGTASCGCGSSSCLDTTASQAAFDFIFSGGGGRAGMANILPGLQKKEVRIEYAASGLGYWTRPNGPVPTVTVSIVDHPVQFFFLGGLLGLGNLKMPSMLSTATGEDLKSTYP